MRYGLRARLGEREGSILCYREHAGRVGIMITKYKICKTGVSLYCTMPFLFLDVRKSTKAVHHTPNLWPIATLLTPTFLHERPQFIRYVLGQVGWPRGTAAADDFRNYPDVALEIMKRRIPSVYLLWRSI
jgi:hypothetical protein